MGAAQGTGFVVVNTVNTRLNNEYDFGVHKAGCRDAVKAGAMGCQLYDYAWAATAEEVVASERADLAGDFGESAAAFTFRVFGCCGGKTRAG